MTGEAQTTLTPATQIVLKRGAGTRGMAGYAIHGCAGARIKGFITDGMGKGAVFPVTRITRFGKPVPQHVRLIGAVPGMAVAAAVRLGMHMQGALTPLQLVGMAVAAHAA